MATGERAGIAAALADMEAIFVAMATAVDAADMDQRRQLIAHRKALVDCYVALNRAVDAASAAGLVEPELASEYRAQFAAFRRAASLHQAEWPTILISDNVANYVAASRMLRVKREIFVTFIRERLLPRVGVA